MHIEQDVLERAVEQLHRTQTDSVSLTDAMEQLAASVTALFGLTGSGLMLIDDDQLLHSVLATDDLGWELEHAQEKTGEGPCVDTLVYGEVVSTTDVSEDERWPELLGEVSGSALGGVLGVPIALGGATVGALNVYVDAPHDWDDSDEHALTAFGSILEALLATALLAEQRDILVKQLQQALDSRVVIERCVGLLMGRHQIDAVAAFNRLRGDARAKRQRVHDLASEILAENG